MAVQESYETTDVLIVGCGPTGALLSALLGKFSIPNVVIEKESAITEDPRGIALDEDGIRLLQEVGIYDKIYTEIGSSFGRANFITSNTDLHETPFLTINFDTTVGGTGHIGAMSHRQPILEKYLRLAASKHSCCHLRTSCTVTHIEEDKDWVYCRYSDVAEGERSIRAKFLVGADGKTGFTRKKYLEPKGVRMEQISSFHYEEIWIALNLKITPPTKETHPDFPLWAQGYTPEQVYDSYFPGGFRFICNSGRPAVCGRFGTGEVSLWRFEFVVKKLEDAMRMASSEETMKVIVPYLTHPGSKYRLSIPSIQFPADCIDVLRSRPFTFSARSCNEWSVDRVILAGDAAHVFPPFGGQGIASGFRDASGLAWRLALACQNSTKNYQHLLYGWSTERRQQLEKSLATTITNGRLCTEGSTWKFRLLQIVLHIIQLVPSWKRWLEMGPRRNGMIKYQWRDGLPFLADFYGGICLPQVYCAPIDSSSFSKELRVHFTDDVIFRQDKKGLFQVIVLLNAFSELEKARKTILELEKSSSTQYVQPLEATFIVQTSEASNLPGAGPNVFRLATAAEFTSIESLCRKRPPPQYYDMYCMKRALHGKRFAIVRPDRFLYAACDTASELEFICQGIQSNLDHTCIKPCGVFMKYIQLKEGYTSVAHTAHRFKPLCLDSGEELDLLWENGGNCY